MTEIIAGNSELQVQDLLSNNEIQDEVKKLFKKYDDIIKENQDAYNFFKDSVINGGDFGSSEVTKEQLAILLQNIKDATDAQFKILDTFIKAKHKSQQIQFNQKNAQNNIYLGVNRREILKTMEEIVKKKEISLTAEVSLSSNELVEKETEVIVPQKEETGFQIKTGEFE